MQTFDFQPTLVGSFITLRPLQAHDFEAVYAAAADPLVWEQHPEPTRFQREVFQQGFWASALASGSAFVVIDNASNRIVGCSRYYDWNPVAKEVAIGYTFLARSHWGGAVNRDMKRLLLDHAFRWAEVVWFHVGPDNRRSRQALAKIGARYSHLESSVAGGVEQLRACYRIDARDYSGLA